MENVIIPIPADIMIVLNQTEQELKDQFQVSIAIMLFQQGKLTLGKAIQLSGLSRFEFEQALVKQKISVSNLSLDQINADVAKLGGL